MKKAEPNKKNGDRITLQSQYLPDYGDLTKLNTKRTILDSVGQEELHSIVSDFMDILQTSSAIYERNGDYALGIFSSKWCRNLDGISRSLCNTSDNEVALNSGKWLCHESCWTSISKVAIETKEPVDKECNGGLRIYAVPIMVDGDCIGAINFAYGSPPENLPEMQPIADLYNVSIESLLELSKEIKRTDPETIELAKKRLQTSALLISKIVQTKQIEKELRESERDLRKSQEIAHLGSWRVDLETNQVKWTEELYKMYGFDPSLPPPPYFEHKKLFTPESWEMLSRAMERTRKNGIPYELELETVKKDGTNGWMWVRGEAIKEPDGRITGLWGAAQDITERKKIHTALEESEEKFRLLFTAIDQGLAVHKIITDENGKPIDYIFLDINESYTRLLGVTREMSIGKRIREVMPKVEQYWIDIFGKVALTGEPSYYENFLETTGRYYSTYSYCPKKNYFAVLVNDITERKLAEEAIAAEKERLAVTLRSIGDGVITTDPQGNLLIMNKVAENLCGWSQEEAVGKPLSEVFKIVNQSTGKPHENPVEKVLSSGKIIELENNTILISRDGKERVIADSGAPIKTKNGKTIGVVLVFRDMTEKQKLSDIVQRAAKLESIGVLAGGIAHDFNNLMGGIFGYIDLANEEPDKKMASSYLEKALNTIGRARALTGQLLTFAKGGAPIQKIGHLFPFVEETARFALSGANVSCHFDVPENLWPCNFDKNQIGQVIDNLVINAQQAMPLGGTIKLSARNILLSHKEHPSLENGKYIKISVKDCGIGIQKDLVSKIFDPFFTTKTKGHGLGLATCYSIVKRHNGCIDVESEPGKGSTFHVYLPASTDSVLPISDKASNVHQGSGIFLIMDDEEIIRDTIKDLLETLGYSVVCKNNGQEAIDFFVEETKGKLEIIGMIFDLTVPGGMGGKAAIEAIRKINSDIPAFVASGYAEDPVMKNPTKYGFMDSICKPFTKSELIEILNRHIKHTK